MDTDSIRSEVSIITEALSLDEETLGVDQMNGREDSNTVSNSSKHQSEQASTSKQRLLTLANRLPITIKDNHGQNTKDGSEGRYMYEQSSGGLVTGLSGLPDCYENVWMGWPGRNVPEEDIDEVNEALKERYGSIPVWIDDALMDLHYNAYCNGIVWPLFHYHSNDMIFYEPPWEAYVKVNTIFAEKAADMTRDNDIVWVHDYHLMLVPEILRRITNNRGLKNVKIGFFLHTPFPSSSEFLKLPYREEILTGLLNADLIGFHTYDYARHFLSAVGRALKLDTSPSAVQFEQRSVHVGAFPIGINPEKELGQLQSDETQSLIQKWRAGIYKDKTVIISVDRLDYIKGLPHKLHAYDMFLQANPGLVGKVVLIQIAVPSRQDVKEYQQLRSHVSELAGRINSKYGTVDYQPFVFQYRSVPPATLVALYAMSDVCLVTSTRDGMNLVAFEYIACQQERHGVLVLSEFAGAGSIFKGCLLINPWDTGDVMEKLKAAVEMPQEEKYSRWAALNKYVMKHTSSYWGVNFMEELARIGTTTTREIAFRQASEVSDSANNSTDSLAGLVAESSGSAESRSSQTSDQSMGHLPFNFKIDLANELEKPPVTNSIKL